MRPTNGSSALEKYFGAIRIAALAVVMLLILALSCSCRVLPRSNRAPEYDSVLLQQRLMRFADDFNSRLVVATEGLRPRTNAVEAIDFLRLKLNCLSSTLAAATGPNELMNLADMFVLVTLTRSCVEEQWVGGPYGETARPLLDACRHGEAHITAIALTVLNQKQLDELRAAIARWQRENPDLRSALFTRALGLEVEVAPARQKSAPGSLFSLLRLDPLASLDPATRELTQARLLGERTLFLAHRKPTLLRWQAELLILETAETPPMLEIRSSTADTVTALERASKTMEELPALVRTEREAIFEGLPAQEMLLTNLAVRLTAMLQAGTGLSESLNTTLETLRGIQETAVTQSSGKLEPTGRPEAGIQDYTESVRQVQLAAEQLTEFMRALNETLQPANLSRISEQVAPVVQQAQTSSRVVVDYAFRRAILLVVFTCAAAFVTALVFNRVRKRPSEY